LRGEKIPLPMQIDHAAMQQPTEQANVVAVNALERTARVQLRPVK
jgi:hypothetical protein